MAATARRWLERTGAAWNNRAMARHILLYGLVISALMLLASWMDWRHATLVWSGSTYGLAVALLFAVLGIWLGQRLVSRPNGPSFARNDKALAELGISPREYEVLELLAQGLANKVIARRLAISPNTVKTHLARLFDKLGAENRTQAIGKARALGLLA